MQTSLCKFTSVAPPPQPTPLDPLPPLFGDSGPAERAGTTEFARARIGAMSAREQQVHAGSVG
jgi:hypothetical protein